MVCQDETGMSRDCDLEGKPVDSEPCNSGPCPLWNYGSWGPVSSKVISDVLWLVHTDRLSL